MQRDFEHHSSNKLSIEESYKHGANFYVVKSYSYRGLLQVLEKAPGIDWQQRHPNSMQEFVIR